MKCEIWCVRACVRAGGCVCARARACVLMTVAYRPSTPQVSSKKIDDFPELVKHI